ncbi:MAG: hypothetical protein R3C69_01265 [Geminicoccaceae bacterium]
MIVARKEKRTERSRFAFLRIFDVRRSSRPATIRERERSATFWKIGHRRFDHR